MKNLKQLTIYTVLSVLFVLVSCKGPEEPKVVFPENDIPVGETSDEALAEFMTGLELYDQGDINNARPYFDKAIELDSNFVSAHMYRVFTSNSFKNWSENREKFLSMRGKANEAEALMMDEIEASMANNTAKELEVYETLVEMYPKSARAMEYLAGYYWGRDEIEKSREYLKKAHELDPDFIPAINSLGTSYLFTSPKDFDQAEHYMQMMVDKLPESSQARISLGDCYRAQNNIEKALESYQKAAELDPNNEVAHSKAGHANTFLGNYEAARQNFRDARAESEYGMGSYNFEAFTYLYEGDHEKALQFLQDGVKMFDAMDVPDSNKNMAKMGLVSSCAMIAMHYGDTEHLKEFAAMMKPMSEQFIAEANNPNTTRNQKANMLYWDALAAASEGDYETAAAIADKIKAERADLDNPNKDRDYHRVHAYVNYKQGDYAKALEHMAYLDKDNVYDLYWMAKANKMAGNEEKAKELFEEVANNNFNSVAYALVRGEAKEMIASTE